MSDIGKAFDKRFKVARYNASWHKHLDRAMECRVGQENGDKRWFVGVLKWFDKRKGPDGLGYVVTNDFGFEKWDKRGSDFVELSFTKKCCRDGIVPRERGIVVFRVGVTEGRRCVIELRSAHFTEEDFKLVLTYNAKRHPTISGTSHKSNWRCHVHVLSSLLHCVPPTEENLIKVKEWINSYLSSLSEDDRNLVIDAWRSDAWFAERIVRWFPDNLSKNNNTSICTIINNQESIVGNGTIELKNAVDEQKGESVMSDNCELLPRKPTSLSDAANEVFHDLYISKVGNRLNELDSPSDDDRRRWIWELVQNAKDSIVNDNVRASVTIELDVTGDVVKFKHNGAPFSAKSRLGLMYQYSKEKDKRGDEGSTGRFGTGFMTTHCLSRKVDVWGDVVAPDVSDGICGFSIEIHREGNTPEEIIRGLEQMEQSEKFYKKPFGETLFVYKVTSDSGRRAIDLGIEEIKRNGCRVLCFCKTIERISVNRDGHMFSIERKLQHDIEGTNVCRFSFEITDDGNKYERVFIVASLDEDNELLSTKYSRDRQVRIDALIEINEQDHSIISHRSDTSVFCVFPVIGIERQLSEPIIINSPDFELTTERNTLYLAGAEKNDNGMPSNVAVNKEIYEKIPCMYKEIISYLSREGYGRLYFLADGLNGVKGVQNLDAQWYIDKVQNLYRKYLLDVCVAAAAQSMGHVPLCKCCVVDEPTKDRPHEIMNLLRSFATGEDIKILIADNDEWVSRLWRGDDIQRWDFESLCSFVESKNNWDRLPFCDDVDKTSWFNRFISLINDVDKSILSRKKLVPDMNGDLHVVDDKSFEQGEGVDDFVIDLLTQLGKDCRANLLNPGIGGIELPRKFNSVRYSSEIDKLVGAIVENKQLNENQRLKKLSPLLRVVVVGDKRDDGFKHKRGMTDYLLRRIFRISDLVPVECSTLLESAWKKCDEWLGQIIPMCVASCGEVDGIISAEICHDKDDVFDLLNRFYKWCKLFHIDVAGKSVFPNQFGTFKPLNELAKENDPIDEKIKELIARIDKGKDPRNNLLDTRCNVDGVKTSSAQEVYSLLDSMIVAGKDNPDIKGTDIFRDVVRELLDDWKDAHENEFARYFPRVSREYNELELNVVHTKEERQLANDLLRKYPLDQLKALAAGRQGNIAIRVKDSNVSATDTIAVSMADGQYAGLADAQKHDALVEAKKMVKVILEKEGYEFTRDICEDEYSIINGVMKDGVEYPLVVHSYIDRSRPFQLNAADWDQLMRPNSMLLVRTGEGICPVPFKNLVCNRDKIDFSISTKDNLDMSDRIASLAHVMRWFKGLRFDFGSLIPMKAGTSQLFDLPENPMTDEQRNSQMTPDSVEEL